MESTNIFIDKFINDKQNNEDPNISLTQNKYVRLSNNIIDINPVPIFIKTTISNATEINTEFNIIAAGMNEQELYVNKNQDPNKESGIFTSQNAYVPMNNILNTDNMYVKLLQQHIFSGIAEMIYTLYNYNGDYKYKINNSWIQKYKSGTFLSPHNHLTSNNANTKTFSVAYYIDDGDPDVTQTYSGCISFIYNNSLTHLRPKSGTLLIWEDHLIHLVNPFFSKSNKERFMLSTNISVEF
jgi:hypothetical protein